MIDVRFEFNTAQHPDGKYSPILDCIGPWNERFVGPKFATEAEARAAMLEVFEPVMRVVREMYVGAEIRVETAGEA